MDFKLRLLKEYYESGSSMYGVSKKYGVCMVSVKNTVWMA